MATYRGQDGSVALGATTILATTEWSFTSTIVDLDTTVQGSGNRTWRGGEHESGGQFTCLLDYGDTTGQKVVVDEFLVGDGDIADLRLHFGAGKYFSGAAVMSNMSITTSRGATTPVPVTFQFRYSGAVTLAWA